jgi:acetyl esterase
MVLFPEARRAVELAAAEPAVWVDGYDVVAARAEATAAGLAERREEVAEVVDLDADGVPCRLYRPAVSSDVTPAEGLVVHLHGGGFVFHDLEVHDAAARRLANRSGLAVLSVDYRKPPEHRFPAAPLDVDTVLAWLERGPVLGAGGLPISGPLYAHGDSAGGNLALVAALRNPGRFRAVALIYPFLDPGAGFDSYRTAADGFAPEEAQWYWQQYAGSPADLTAPDLAPLLSDRLDTLPPTLVVTAEHDPLRDEGEHLALLLAEAGVEVVSTRYQGQVHGFWRHVEAFPAAEALVRQVAGFLRLHH